MDDGLLSIIPASCGQSVKMLKTLEPHGIFRFCILIYFNIVQTLVLIDFSLTVKAATLIFRYGCGSAVSSSKQGKSGVIYHLVKK